MNLSEERYNHLVNLVLKVSEADPRLWDTRKAPYPTLRSLVWAQMKAEGFTVTQIGAVSHKTHSTVSILVKKIQSIIKENNPSWKDMLMVWEKLQDELLKEEPKPNKEQTYIDRRKARIVQETLSLPLNEQTALLKELHNQISKAYAQK